MGKTERPGAKAVTALKVLGTAAAALIVLFIIAEIVLAILTTPSQSSVQRALEADGLSNVHVTIVENNYKFTGTINDCTIEGAVYGYNEQWWIFDGMSGIRYSEAIREYKSLATLAEQRPSVCRNQ